MRNLSNGNAPVDLGSEFELERLRRELEGCHDIAALRRIAHQALSLYRAQQDALKAMAQQGWLPL